MRINIEISIMNNNDTKNHDKITSILGKMINCSLVGAVIVVSAVIAISLNKCAAETCEVRLRIDAGWVCGRVRDAEDGTKYASFRGVPYAEPPLGDKRFKELGPPEPWDHLFDATEDGTACPQKEFFYSYSRMTLQLKGMSEDCIHLNLHVPYHALPQPGQEQSGVGVPILVFVHGGAFHVGSSLTDLHGPEYLLRKDVIAITFNYRISVFGFLSLDTEQIPGNQGLRDVITLLRWVKRNARAFGGNPDDVTLAGHSTGGSMAHMVSLSEVADGLIHKVVLMSGNAINGAFTPNPKHARFVADAFLRALGINSTDKDYIAQRLYKEPLLNIVYAASMVQLTVNLDNFLVFAPVVESKFPNITTVLDDDPYNLIAKGRGKQYPLLSGFTNAEFHFFKWAVLVSNQMARVEIKPKLLLPAHIVYNEPEDRQLEIANLIRQRYFNGTPTLDQMLDCISDVIFIYPTLKLAEWRAIAGAPVYLYQFSYEGIRNIIKEALWYDYEGVVHVEDLTYVWRVNSMLNKSDRAIPKNTDDLMRDWMSSIIVNFVRCGTPTCVRDDSRWPALTKKHQYQEIRVPNIYKMSHFPKYLQDMVSFFDSVDDRARAVQETIIRTTNLKS